jgi:hypothetical protein
MELQDLSKYSSNFYEEIYKDLYKNEIYLKNNSNLKSIIEKIVDMPKASNQTYIKQLEFYPLAVDFLKAIYNNKHSFEDVARTIDVSNEFLYIWYESFNQGKIVTPVNFKKDTIEKISEIVLNDKLYEYVSKNNIKEEDINIDLIIPIIIKETKALYEPPKKTSSNKLNI